MTDKPADMQTVEERGYLGEKVDPDPNSTHTFGSQAAELRELKKLGRTAK
jgi:hypothetical protein